MDGKKMQNKFDYYRANNIIFEKYCSFRDLINNQHSVSLDLSIDSIKSECPYLRNINRFETNEISINGILMSLRKELGNAYNRLLRSKKNSKTSAKSSVNKNIVQKDVNFEISFISSESDTETNTVEIPGTVYLHIESLSIHDKKQLFLCIISLLAKVTQYEADIREIDGLYKIDYEQDYKIDKISKKLEKNGEKLLGKLDEVNDFKKQVAEDIKRKKDILLEKKKLTALMIEEKKELEKVVDGLESRGFDSKKLSLLEKFRELESIKKQISEQENKRIALDRRNEKILGDYKEDFRNLSVLQVKLVEEKARFNEKIKINSLKQHSIYIENIRKTQENLQLS